MLTDLEIRTIYYNIGLSERAIKEQGTEDSPDLLEGITPGEWRINQSFHIWGNDCKIAALDNNIQSTIYRMKSVQEMKANARLIAAAPKLAAENKELKQKHWELRERFASHALKLTGNEILVEKQKERIEVLTKALENINGMCADACTADGVQINTGLIAKISIKALNQKP